MHLAPLVNRIDGSQSAHRCRYPLDRRTLQAHRNKTQDLNWSHQMRTLFSAFLVLISLTAAAAAAAENCPDVNWEARQTITVPVVILTCGTAVRRSAVSTKEAS